MKKPVLVVCILVLACHMSVRPSLAQETTPWPHADVRPIHAAIAAAGDNYSHLLSQSGSNRISGRQGRIIALASAIGFGVGYAAYYFKNRPLDYSDERAHAMASGTFSAVLAGALTWAIVTGP